MSFWVTQVSRPLALLDAPFRFLTSVTGFLFPRAGFTPAQGVGIVSLVVLAAALLALYAFRLAGAWRWIYVTSATLALYLKTRCFFSPPVAIDVSPMIGAAMAARTSPGTAMTWTSMPTISPSSSRSST